MYSQNWNWCWAGHVGTLLGIEHGRGEVGVGLARDGH